MHHFFVSENDINNGRIYLGGADFNHAANVLRLKKGEKVLVSDQDATDYICFVEGVRDEASGKKLVLAIEETLSENHELSSKVVLFQCIPKADKMENIIQKAVELGVSAVVPVISKNCVVRLDEKKALMRQRRWQAIAESAAKQSKRSIVPEVSAPVDIREAINLCGNLDIPLIPYEHESGLTGTCEAIISFLPGRSIGVLVGPEGGFDRLEVSMAGRHGLKPVSLGKRILRADTAAIAILSLVMIRLEIAAWQDDQGQ